jgi:hypothetical protein
MRTYSPSRDPSAVAAPGWADSLLTRGGPEEAVMRDNRPVSIAMFFRTADGVLVVADGREVADLGGRFDWRSDQARKLTSYEGPAPVIAAAVGVASVGVDDTQRDVLAVIDDVLISDRPPLTIAAGEGPWTAKAVAHVARHRTEDLTGSLGDSMLVARVVDWQADVDEPTMWGFELRPINHIEDGKNIPSTASTTMEFSDFARLGMSAVPESALWDLVRRQYDRTFALADEDAEMDDPRWIPPVFTLVNRTLSYVAEHVEQTLRDLQATNAEVFLSCQVGGDWIFGELRPGRAPTFTSRPIGPTKQSLSALDSSN